MGRPSPFEGQHICALEFPNFLPLFTQYQLPFTNFFSSLLHEVEMLRVSNKINERHNKMIRVEDTPLCL